MCVLQRQEGVGGDGALALALGVGQQVADGQLSGGERDGGNLGRGGEGLQLLEVLLLLHQLVEQHLLLLLGGGRKREGVREGGEEEWKGKKKNNTISLGQKKKKKKGEGMLMRRTTMRDGEQFGNLAHHSKENCSKMYLRV